MKRTLCAIFAVGLLFCCLSACTSSPAPDGRFDAERMILGEITYDKKDLDALGIESFIVFHPDGSGFWSFKGTADPFRWDDGTLTDSLGVSHTFSFDGSTVTLETEDMTVCFR